jgi:hypothetical protein
MENCHLHHGVEFDSGEDIITKLVPVAEIPKLVADEKIGIRLLSSRCIILSCGSAGLKKLEAK